MQRLAGRSALITGGAAGIGDVCSEVCGACAGYFLLDRRAGLLELFFVRVDQRDRCAFTAKQFCQRCANTRRAAGDQRGFCGKASH